MQGKLLDVTREVCGYSKANPDILKHGAGAEMWMWLYVGGIYIGSGDTIRKRKTEKNALKAKKCTKRIVVMAVDLTAWDAVERVDSCHDINELFRIVKQRAGEKCDVIGVNCLKDEGWQRLV